MRNKKIKENCSPSRLVKGVWQSRPLKRLVVLLWNGLEAICRDDNNTSGWALRPQVWVLFLMVYHRVPSWVLPYLPSTLTTSFPICWNLVTLESYVDDSKLYLWFLLKDTWSVVQQINDDLLKIASWCRYVLIVFWSTQTRPSCWCWVPADFHVTLLGKDVTTASPGLQETWDFK